MQRVPLTIFYSYADKDEKFRQILERHLSAMRQEGVIVEWHRNKIVPGAHRADSRNEHFAKAAIILLLISPDYLDSEYHRSEMQQAMERHASGEAHVIPILLHPVDWSHTPIASLQYLPRNGKPVDLWKNHDEAFLDITHDIRSVVENLSHAPFQRQPAARADALTNNATGHRGLLCCQYDLHTDGVISVDWSPDGTQLASGGLDSSVQIWDAATGQHIRIYRGHSPKQTFALPIAAVYTVRWSPDGARIASAGNSGHIQIWDPTNGQKMTSYEGHSRLLSDIFHAVWSHDGRRIASTSISLNIFDETVHIWNAQNGHGLLKINLRDTLLKSSSPGGVAWSPDGTRIAGAWNRTVQIFRADTGKRIFSYQEHTGWISTVNWSPDGKYLASAETKTIRVWDAITGTTLGTYSAHERAIRDFAWSPDSRYIASASEDNTVHIWEPTTGTQLFIYRGHSHYVTSVAWSPDSTRIASGSLDKTVHVWQAV